MKRYGIYGALSALIIIADQIAKALIVANVPFYGSVKVIPGFLDLTHIHNKGAILGFMNNAEHPAAPILILALNLAALVLVVFYFTKTTERERLTRVSLAMITGGALGNIVDRLARGFVVDFVDMYAGKFHWPIYNVADASISIGAVLLIVSVLFRSPHASDPV